MISRHAAIDLIETISRHPRYPRRGLLEPVEVRSGDHLGEDDILRHVDARART